MRGADVLFVVHPQPRSAHCSAHCSAKHGPTSTVTAMATATAMEFRAHAAVVEARCPMLAAALDMRRRQLPPPGRGNDASVEASTTAQTEVRRNLCDRKQRKKEGKQKEREEEKDGASSGRHRHMVHNIYGIAGRDFGEILLFLYTGKVTKDALTHRPQVGPFPGPSTVRAAVWRAGRCSCRVARVCVDATVIARSGARCALAVSLLFFHCSSTRADAARSGARFALSCLVVVSFFSLRADVARSGARFRSAAARRHLRPAGRPESAVR